VKLELACANAPLKLENINQTQLSTNSSLDHRAKSTNEPNLFVSEMQISFIGREISLPSYQSSCNWWC
jgi:hypothetical protein